MHVDASSLEEVIARFRRCFPIRVPQPMRAAAGTVPEAVAAHAEADNFIKNLRRQALAPQAGGTP